MRLHTCALFRCRLRMADRNELSCKVQQLCLTTCHGNSAAVSAAAVAAAAQAMTASCELQHRFASFRTVAAVGSREDRWWILTEVLEVASTE